MKKSFTLLLFSLLTIVSFSQQEQVSQYFLLLDDSILVHADTTYITIPDTLTYEQLKTVKKVKVVEVYANNEEMRYIPYTGDVWVVGLAGNSILDSNGIIKTKLWGTDSTAVYSVWNQFRPGKHGTLSAKYQNKNGKEIAVGAHLYSTK